MLTRFGAPVFSLAALLAVAASSRTAAADEPQLPAPPESSVFLGESAWDIPGWVVVDLDDDLSMSEVKEVESSLAAKLPGLQFFDSDLGEETRIQLARVPGLSVEQAITRVVGDERIEGAEPLAWVRANYVPNDPLYEKQWHMTRVGAETAWNWGTGRGVTIAVIDTGIACEDFNGFSKGTDLNATRCVDGWNFIRNDAHANDDHGHGTHVAGTIAQTTNNGVGAAGLAFGARLMPVKVLDKGGWGTTVDIANGIRWASDHGAQVINLSLGGPRNSKVLEDAVAHARAQGTVVVAAAGNSGGSVGFPGGSTGVIGVSATDPSDKLASFSSRGKGVDIAAPGVDVVQQTICDGGKNACEIFPGWKGTSMASPHVAGAAALLVGAGLSDPEAVETALLKSARDVDPSSEGRAFYGAGILDAGAAARATTLQQGLWRSGLLALFALLLTVFAKQRDKTVSVLSPGFALGGVLAGPGFFLLPFVASRAFLPVDLLSRPLGELDLFVGASLHRLLPLANVFVPLALLVTTFHVKRLRGFVGGIAAGTASFLVSLLALGQTFSPFGQPALWLWLSLNAVLCLLVARFALKHRD
jgi:serine protease